MAVVILILLIPVAYYVGRFAQWWLDVRRFMRMWRGEG